MRIAFVCFIAAAVAATCGMCLGIWMGIHEDFTLAPVHAHVNLLGWVTLGLYGLYHRGMRRTGDRLAWAQVGVAILAVPMLSIGLAIYLGTGSDAAEPVVVLGSLMALAGMLLFLAIVVRDAREGWTGLNPGEKSLTQAA